jgi:hypothetical protein
VLSKILSPFLILIVSFASIACANPIDSQSPPSNIKDDKPTMIAPSLAPIDSLMPPDEIKDDKSRMPTLALALKIEEAEKQMGIEIPLPQYLPEGYEIKDVVPENANSVLLLFNCNASGFIELRINWKPDGVPPARMPPGWQSVTINGSAGYLLVGDKNTLAWTWVPERYKPGIFTPTIETSKDIPVSELLLVAGSLGWQ